MSRASIDLHLDTEQIGRTLVRVKAVVPTTLVHTDSGTSIETGAPYEASIIFKSMDSSGESAFKIRRVHHLTVTETIRGIGQALLRYADQLDGFAVPAPAPPPVRLNEAEVLRTVADRIEMQDEPDNMCPVHGGEWGDDDTCSNCTDADADADTCPRHGTDTLWGADEGCTNCTKDWLN